MKERGIPMTGPNVRAILDGRKTQTRRIVKLTDFDRSDTPGYDFHFRDKAMRWHDYRAADLLAYRCPYGVPGDRLWVRETWAYRRDMDHLNGSQLYEIGVREAWYWADGPGKCCNTGCAGAAGRVRAARFMPRWVSRITLELTDVRVERLQEISEADAEAEGIERDAGLWKHYGCVTQGWIHARNSYQTLWESINGPGSWDANPWVWVLSFRRIET